MKNLFLLCISLSVLFFISCLETDASECGLQTNFQNVDQDLLDQGIQEIDQFLSDSSIVAIEDPTGLRYVINQEGVGAQASLCNDIIVIYEGSILSTGEVFDSSKNANGEEVPIRLPLSGVIAGWQIGIPKIKQGGSITLYIPSELGYGEDGSTDIPANSNLKFTVTYIQ